MKFLARYNFNVDSYEIHIKNSTNAIVTGLVYTKLEPGSFISTEPPIMLKEQEAQELMDQLYAIGIRPAGARGSLGQLDAVKYHLEDLRKLVFK